MSMLRRTFASLKCFVEGYMPSTAIKKNRENHDGFTLMEIMIVVGVIGLLAMIAMPSFSRARMKGQASADANNLRVFSEAVQMYAMDNGFYPDDSHNVLPDGPGIENYIKENKWLGGPALGGNYNWEGPDNYPFAGISLHDTPASVEALTILDEMIDNGVLGSGAFRLIGGRYTFIVEE